MASSLLSDLDPLLLTLDDLSAGLHAINHPPRRFGPPSDPSPGWHPTEVRLSAVCCVGRRSVDPTAGHRTAPPSLPTITYIARFVLETFSGTEPWAATEDLSF